MEKYYFRNEDSEMCYTLDYHIEQAQEDGLTEIELFTAVPEKIDGMIWCKAVDDCGEKGECGKQCEFYEPRNGKSGMCKNQGRFYEPDKKIKFPVPAKE
jgi:hypothetical protein